jgi:hypothetical protein
MPDPNLIVFAAATAALLAGVLMLACWWPWRSRVAASVGVGRVLGEVAGFVAGCWLLGIRPHWPLSEDLDRLLAVVVPATAVVEIGASWHKVPNWLRWAMRLVVAAGTAWVLLHGSSYLVTSSTGGSVAWSAVQTWLILVGLGAGLAIAWWLLAVLSRRAPVSTTTCLAMASAGAAVTVMLSGYATGGQIGLPLAGAALGTAAVSLLLPQGSRAEGSVGIVVVVLFSLLVIGHFFGELTWLHLILLSCAPVLGWLPEIPPLRRVPAWLRGLLRVVLVGVLVAGVVVAARRNFVEQFESVSAPYPGEPAVDDYLNYGR